MVALRTHKFKGLTGRAWWVRCVGMVAMVAREGAE